MAYTALAIVPPVIETPATGTQTYKVRLHLYDSNTAMMVPDSAPIVALANASGTSLAARLSSVTGAQLEAYTGIYEWTYTADSSHATEQLMWLFLVIENTVTSIFGATSLIVASIDAIKTFTSSGTLDGILDASALQAIAAAVPVDSVMTTRLMSTTAAAKLERSAKCIATGTVGDTHPSSPTTIVIIGSQSPAKTTATAFKDRGIFFPEDTTTVALRGAFATILTGGSNTEHLLDRALPGIPVSGDTYSIN